MEAVKRKTDAVETPNKKCPREVPEKFISRINSGFAINAIPNRPSGCTWNMDTKNVKSPHRVSEWKRTKKVLPNILEAIGNTPMVKLNNIPKKYGVKCEMLVKCEFLNPGGSIKDRIGYRMVEDAERSGVLKPGATIIEPTSGNTGIGIALAAAVKGYRCIIIISEKMSNEKVDTLKALGAEVIRFPITEPFDSPNGLFGISARIKSETPNSIILDQYSNPGNPLAHYDTTAEEIWDQCDGKIDMLVVGTGTGGSMTGIGRKIKELSPNTIIVGADPEGSILALPESLNKTDVDFYEVEGVGYDFVPTVLDRSIVDKWVKVNDKEAFPVARELIKMEGLLSGGSSGANVAGAIKVASLLKEGQRMVIILPDGIRNYMTKFVSDQWLEARNLQPLVNTLNHWWWDVKVENLPLEPLTTIDAETTCDKVLNTMKKHGIDQVPIIDKNGGVKGVIVMQKLLNTLVSGKLKAKEPISKIMDNVYPKAFKSDCLGLVSRTLEKQSYILIVEKNGGIEKPVSIITAVDFIHYISNNEQTQ